MAQDADAVVAALNGFDVQGRKLRVEYKKVLQAGEKERIEREKALRRMRSMQLEKEQLAQAQVQTQVQQHPFDEFGPVINPGTTPSKPYTGVMYSSYSSVSPAPTQSFLNTSSPHGTAASPTLSQPSVTTPAKISSELDLNDPVTLDIYSRILLFKDDHMRDELAFSRTLTPKQRRIVHLVAQRLGVYHYSVGEGEERYAVVTRVDPQSRVRYLIKNLYSFKLTNTSLRLSEPYPKHFQEHLHT